MIDLNLGGACPRRPITHALPRAMKDPHAPQDGDLGDCDLGVVAINGSMAAGVDLLAALATRSGMNWLMANFGNEVTTLCSGLVILRHTGAGLLVSMVEPCLLHRGASMILVTLDRKLAFEMMPDGRLVDRPVPRPARVKEGVERGWTELVRRMRAQITESGAFRHKSVEIHILPAS